MSVEIALGVLLSLIAGCCAAGVLISSRRLAERGVTALQISAARFHFAWVICGIFTIPTIDSVVNNSLESLLPSAIIGVICIAAPILLLQWGITIAKSLHAALIISLLPAVVMFGEFIIGGTYNPVLILGMIILTSISIVGVLKH